MASKIVFEEKDNGLQVSGRLVGSLAGIMNFTEMTFKSLLVEVYNAADAQEAKPGIDKEALGVFCAMAVMRNAFNDFIEDHKDAFEGALELDGNYEEFAEKKEAN